MHLATLGFLLGLIVAFAVVAIEDGIQRRWKLN